MLRSFLGLFAFLIAMILPASGRDDPVKVKLDKAKDEYEKSLTRYREFAKDYFDKREEAARKDGNKKTVDLLKKERETFENSGELPSSAPATLRSRPDSALATLTAAYNQAVKDYIRIKQDDLAAAMEKELEAVKAKAGYPVIAGVWQEGPAANKIRVIIVQKGKDFVATTTFQHKEAGEISWRLTGTITKDGDIKGDLVVTKSPPGWLNQIRTGKFSASAGMIKGRAEFKGGGHDFEWKRVLE